jgi:hypothetical protein|nr:MAG TPA: hypothetical protein [Caudoviricetes sp.]
MGPATHRVTGAVAVLATTGGSERYLYRGAVLDAADWDAAALAHAVAVGLVAPLDTTADDGGGGGLGEGGGGDGPRPRRRGEKK